MSNKWDYKPKRINIKPIVFGNIEVSKLLHDLIILGKERRDCEISHVIGKANKDIESMFLVAVNGQFVWVDDNTDIPNVSPDTEEEDKKRQNKFFASKKEERNNHKHKQSCAKAKRKRKKK